MLDSHMENTEFGPGGVHMQEQRMVAMISLLT